MWKKIQEKYSNIIKILKLLNFKDLKFKEGGYIKIANIILCLSGHEKSTFVHYAMVSATW